MNKPLEKFQDLLRELFQFDCADLDFGIYRIMNHKRDVIEKFITKDLPKTVAEELERGALAEQSNAAKELESTRKRVLESLGEDALDNDGNLDKKYCETNAGKDYLSARGNAAGARGRDALEASIFNHLYAFLSRYYQDGDFISKRRYSKRERYAIPYNGEEVYLYWANHDQYYVKTAEHFTDYTFTAPNEVCVHFKLQAADVEQDNVKGYKRFFLPFATKLTWDEVAGQLVIPFEYRPLTNQEENKYGQKNQQDAIIAKAIEEISKQLSLKTAGPALAALMTEHRKTSDGQSVMYLEHHLRQYTRRNTSDFFIHKDLKGFLSRELDFYLKNEVLNLDEIAAASENRAEGWFQMMRVIKAVGGRIIEFLAQIENFQKMLWEKRKFITETQYCITMGNIAEDFYPEIASRDAQWDEWKELFHIDEEQTDMFTAGKSKTDRRIAFLKAHATLVLDTRHFPADFTDRLVGSFNDLDEMTDGLLVHSENFQALNLLLEKYRENVNCIYIDPPYNTGDDGFIYKDNYKHSSWISMLRDRLELARRMLSDTSALATSINDLEVERLTLISDEVFGEDNHISTLVWNTEGHTDNQYDIKENHEYIQIYARNRYHIEIGYVIDPNTREQSNLWKGFAENSITKNGPGNPPSEVRLPMGFPVACDSLDLPACLPPKDFFDAVKRKGFIAREHTKQYGVSYPIRLDPMRAALGRLKATCRVFSGWANVDKLRAFINNNCNPQEVNGEILSFFISELGVLYYRKERTKARNIYSVLRKMGTTEQMRSELEAMGINIPPKLYPKPKQLLAYVLRVLALNGGFGLDFFAGSGSTGHAVISLNREDGGHRKFIMVEMADYFDTVLLPRIKKITFTPEWKDGKPKRMATEEETERSPRIVKYIRLESYEDTLNNIAFDDSSGQQAMKFDDYLLQYMLKWETRKSETMLNIEKLARPFHYKLHIHADGQSRERLVDIPETFSYLLGLHVQMRRSYDDDGRRYLVYRGKTSDSRTVAVIWRETEGWQKVDLERDKRFVSEKKLAEGADKVFVNGDSFIPNAKALEPIFKARMFTPVEA